ncbi:MAG: hypothetical protein EON92_09800 [Burkholderiales bacterium]|nr:MAG: hypothetical protein EON92_09800 [Burkholderiales bacterium]
MKASKSLTSAVVAAALVGSLGMAVAQTNQSSSNIDTTTNNTGGRLAETNTYGSNMGSANLAPQAPAANMGTANTTAAPMAATPAPMNNNSNTTAFQGERPAQADRN